MSLGNKLEKIKQKQINLGHKLEQIKTQANKFRKQIGTNKNTSK